VSSTGGKVAQVVALIVGVVLVIAGVRQCSTKSETVTSGSSAPSTAADRSSTTTTAAGGGVAVSTTAIQTTTTFNRVTTTLQPMAGTIEIKPAGAAFATSYPYPNDQANPSATPILEWNITIPAGQKLEIRGPAPGTADAVLSGGAKGQFVPCPGTLTAPVCSVPAGTYTYSAVLVQGETVMSRKSVALVIGGPAGGV